MAEFVCREFEERDWPELVRFYEKFYRPGYVLAQRKFFDWNFCSPLRQTEQSGQRILLDGSRVIGIMGSVAWPIQSHNRQVMGQCAINLFLDPSYRNRGLWRPLLNRVCLDSPYTVSSGYAEHTLPMYRGFGRVYHWQLRRVVKCLDAKGCEELMRETPSFSTLSDYKARQALEQLRSSAATSAGSGQFVVKRVQRFGDEWDAGWCEMRSRYGFTTWRSADFLNWRYIDYPFPLYRCYVAYDGEQIAGLLVLRVESPAFGSVVRVIDLVCQRGAEPGMLAGAEELAKDLRATFVDFVFQGAANAAELGAAGYSELVDDDGATLLPMDFNPVRHRERILTLILVRDPADLAAAELERGAFYLVKGDSDQDRAN
jgi:hypothetical protein